MWLHSLLDFVRNLFEPPLRDEDRSAIDEPDGIEVTAVEVGEPLPPPAPEPEPEPEFEPPGVVHVGAWCGLSAIRNPERDIAFAAKTGIDRLDVIVNDHSAAREPRDFDTYDRDAIVRFCHKAHRAGIETHLMTWIMPHAAYIEQAAEQLSSLVAVSAAASIQFDAEEPWTQAQKRLKYAEAGKLVGDAFRGLCPIGVNGIGYTPSSKFGPLAEVADYLVPQCYSTSTSGQRPQDVVPKFHRRWRKVFGHRPQHVIGLAAYRQKDIPGHSVETAMRTALAGAQALEGIDTVIYWSLRHIRRSSRVARVIRSIRQPQPVA